jgi:hypothetical protein
VTPGRAARPLHAVPAPEPATSAPVAAARGTSALSGLVRRIRR